MSKHSVTRRLTTVDLAKMKSAGEKIAMLTCYDASFAQSCDAAGIDSILVGDSLGMVVQGHDSPCRSRSSTSPTTSPASPAAAAAR